MSVTSRPEVVIVADQRPDVRVVPDLRRHIPRVALDWDDVVPPGQKWQVLDASMVFADISGFTALTERLATRGRIGAEELIETLNRVFGAMLTEAAIRGGEMLKFGGDALLFLFRGEEHAARACRSAVDMRQALKEAAKIPTSVGRLKLSMSVGIHSGPVDFFLVGSPTRELLILGSAGTATTEAEHAAVAGQILITESTAAYLPKGSTELRDDGLHRLRWRFAYPPEGEGPPTPQVPPERLRTLFPHELGEYLDERVPDPEHKIATIGFARFSGTDAMLRAQGHEAVAAVLHETLSVFEAAMIEEGVTLLATDIDADGGKLFMASGVPFSTEDDEGRMLRAMRRVLDVGTPLPVQIGVNRGHVFAAEVGTLNRSAYSAMGDTTNTAARIMSKADGGVLFAHPTVIEHSRTLFAVEPAGPFPMKGKTEPVLVLEVGEETGTREAHGRASLPLVGRDAEVAEIRAALEEALGGDGGVVTVSAATGLGKSRVISEAMRGLEATVVTVRAEPYGMTSPYRMLRDPVRQAFGVERGEPEEMSRTLLASFERLMPELLPLAPLIEDVVSIPVAPTPEATAIEPQYRPVRIADIIVRLVERAVRGPFVLLVEEAHWADSASIAVLQRVASSTAGRPWAVVVARRSEGEGLELEQGLHVELGPLPPEALREALAGAVAGAPLRPHEIDGIVARAQGNPLFAEELLRVFREVGSLESLPDNLHAALDAEIDRLDPQARRALRYASVLGRSFRRSVLDETLRYDDDGELDAETFDRLKSFLEADGPQRLRFRNSMIRDAAYEGLAYRTRAKLHAAAGRAVETLSTDLDADADTLSLHYFSAGIQDRAWRFSKLAGDLAFGKFASVEAVEYYRRALEAGRRLTDVPDEDRFSVYDSLGAARMRLGMYEDSIAAFRAARKLVPHDPRRQVALYQAEARATVRLEKFSQAMRTLSRTITTLDEAGDSLPESDRLSQRAQVEALYAWCLLLRGRATQGLEWGHRAEVDAEASGDAFAKADAYDALFTLYVVLGQHPPRPYGELALAAFRDGGFLIRQAGTLVHLGMEAALDGRCAEAQEHYLESEEVARRAGATFEPASAQYNQADLLLHLGRPAEAEAVLRSALPVFQSLGSTEWAASTQRELGRAAARLGRPQEAERLARAARADLESLGLESEVVECDVVIAEAMLVDGQPDHALRLAEAALTVAEATESTQAVRSLLLLRARILRDAGRLDEARAALEAGLPLCEADGRWDLGYFLRGLAEIAARQGDPAADDLASRAREELARQGIDPEI
ncbi:MAG: adenylate/guanylate cyclase domain-containing protein [Candidatus Nanopelagicales bacterium]